MVIAILNNFRTFKFALELLDDFRTFLDGYKTFEWLITIVYRTLK